MTFRALSCVVLGIPLLFVLRSDLSAEPHCPGYTRTYAITGSIPPNSPAIDHDLSTRSIDDQMYPCDKMSVQISATNEQPGTWLMFSASLRTFDGTASYWNTANTGIYGGATEPMSLPIASAPIPVKLGTPNENLDVVKWITVSSNTIGYNATVSYTLTITLESRPYFNRGGPTSAEALPITVSPLTVYGTIPLSRYQYFKVSLPDQGTVTASGTLTNIGVYPAYYQTFFMNDTGGYLSGGGSVTVNANSQATFQNHSYTNTTGQTKDVYLVVNNTGSYSVIEPFAITIQATGLPAPTLTLFLDADSNFNPSNPQSDDAGYVPGAALVSLASVPLPQRLQVIAAYTDQSGAVIAPADGVTSATFELQNTSAFKGFAMNAGYDENPDFTVVAITGGTPGSSASGTFGNDHTSRVYLDCYDYGGLTTVSVAGAASLHVPKDTQNNWIADTGWIAGIVTISDTALGNGADEDTAPSVSGPPDSLGLTGDGLTNFEEYRGFIVRGTHRRTNPFMKDLFISSDVDTGIAFAYPNLPLAVHRIVGEDDVSANGSPEYRVSDRGINFNATNDGVEIPGHFEQSALRIMAAGFKDNVLGETHGVCANNGKVPTTVTFIEIFVGTHDLTLGGLGYTPSEITNEMKRTVAHEVGHGVHIKHRNASDACDDGANTGSNLSVMTSGAQHGQVETHPASLYNSEDQAQIRLHVRPF